MKYILAAAALILPAVVHAQQIRTEFDEGNSVISMEESVGGLRTDFTANDKGKFKEKALPTVGTHFVYKLKFMDDVDAKLNFGHAGNRAMFGVDMRVNPTKHLIVGWDSRRTQVTNYGIRLKGGYTGSYKALKFDAQGTAGFIQASQKAYNNRMTPGTYSLGVDLALDAKLGKSWILYGNLEWDIMPGGTIRKPRYQTVKVDGQTVTTDVIEQPGVKLDGTGRHIATAFGAKYRLGERVSVSASFVNESMKYKLVTAEEEPKVENGRIRYNSIRVGAALTF